MKSNHLFLILVITVSTFFACKKQDNPSPTTPTLEGEWIWVESSGGIGGIVVNPEVLNTTKSYIFDATTLSIIEDGQKTGTVTYKTSVEKSLLYNKDKNFLLYDKSNCAKCALMEKNMFSFSTNKDSLYLEDDVYDGMIHKFIKKRNDNFKAATYVGIDARDCATACCGAFLINIEGRTYGTLSFPKAWNMNTAKTPQKMLIKTIPTPYSCTPLILEITEGNLIP